MLKLFPLAILVSSILFCSTAQAVVIYEWRNIRVDEALGPVTGVIVIDDGYWSQGGSLSGVSNGSCEFPNVIGDDLIPAYTEREECRFFGVDRFFFDAPGLGQDTINLRRVEDVIGPFGPINGTGDAGFEGTFDFDLTILGSVLSGDIYADNLAATLRMSGGPVWNIELVSGDGAVGPCYSNEPTYCPVGVATGIWIRVPEPSSIILCATALLGLLFAQILPRRGGRLK